MADLSGEARKEEHWLLRKDFMRHSGSPADFKVECDALTSVELDAFAHLIHKKFRFSTVFGVPRGGRGIARALRMYCEFDTNLPCLIVDDVGTTGASMEKQREDMVKVDGGVDDDYLGVVLFWVGEEPPPSWICPVFTLWNQK